MHRFRLDMYIPVSYTNRRPIKNMVGAVFESPSRYGPEDTHGLA